MPCPFKLVLRSLFLAFFLLNAWNHLKDFHNYHDSWVANARTYINSFKEVTGLDYPKSITEVVFQNSVIFCQGIIYATLTASALSMLGIMNLTWFVGLIYMKFELMNQNIITFNTKTSLQDWERLAMVVTLFVGSIAVSCGGKKGKRCGKMKQQNDKKSKQ